MSIYKIKQIVFFLLLVSTSCTPNELELLEESKKVYIPYVVETDCSFDVNSFDLPPIFQIQQPLSKPEIGEKAYKEKVKNALKYPYARKDFTGKVYVLVSIDTLGSPSNYEIISGLDSLIDKNVIEAMKAVNEKFIPQISDKGEKVEAHSIISIDIKL